VAQLLTGTVRADRGLPVELRNMQLATGSSSFMRAGPVLAVKFVDKTFVEFDAAIQRLDGKLFICLTQVLLQE
jgi:hypothetical protein